MVKILVLEDDPEFSALLSDSLGRYGHDAYMCSNVADALDAFIKIPFDIVLADLIVLTHDHQAQEGGLILIWRIREIMELQKRHVPIIAMSGTIYHTGMQHALDTARHLGADYALPKPFPPNELHDCITMLTEKALDADSAAVLSSATGAKP